MGIDTNSTFFKEFASGDLIYGTEIDRKLYYHLAELKATKVTIDSITREMDHTIRGWGDFANVNVTPEQLMQLPQSAQFFLQYAQKTVFWNKMNGSAESCRNNYTKLGVAKGMPTYGNRTKMSEPYFRAKCKVGIGFVIDNGFTVRFVLDSLYHEDKMETIARKESDQPWHTGSELRYLYRRSGDPRTSESVVFYVNGEHVLAPWVNFPKAWDHYGDTRMEKIPEYARK